METRKLQYTGESTYTISLPKKWIKRKGLNRGDNVFISEREDETLVISAEKKKGERIIKSIDITRLVPTEIMRKIIANYINGFDELKITSKAKISTNQRDGIKDALAILVGPQILEESSDKVTIQDLLDMSDLSPKKVLRRMQLMSASMYMNAMESLTTSDKDLAYNVIGRDSDVDKLYLLISRQLGEVVKGIGKIDVPPNHSLSFLIVAKSYERIADHATKIAGSVLLYETELSEDILKSISNINTKILEVLDLSAKSFFGLDEKAANKVLEMNSEIQTFSSRSIRDIQTQPSSVLKVSIVRPLSRTSLQYGNLSIRG